MPVTVEFQSWGSVDYNWLDNTGATSAPVQIYNKLVAWAATVNANPSCANRQVTILKGPDASSSADFVGFVFQLNSPSPNSTVYCNVRSSSTTNLVATTTTNWTDDGANGGYGTYSGSSGSDTAIAWAVSGVTAEFAVATGTEDGEEFFCLGWRINNSTATQDILCYFKDQNNEWATYQSDGGSVSGSYYNIDAATPVRQFSVSGSNAIGPNGSSGNLCRLTLVCSGTIASVPVGGFFTNLVVAKSPNLYYSTTSAEWGFGRWAQLVDGRKAVCMGYGPLWVIY